MWLDLKCLVSVALMRPDSSVQLRNICLLLYGCSQITKKITKGNKGSRLIRTEAKKHIQHTHINTHLVKIHNP
jgi:hypothetical protein